jgi:hypothetical protein
VFVEFSSDELILTLVSLIRAIDRRLLSYGPDGFTMDFHSIERKEQPTPDERLLLRLRGALDTSGQQDSYGLELSMGDRQRLAEALRLLDAMQQWPPDVTQLSTGLQERLLSLEA